MVPFSFFCTIRYCRQCMQFFRNWGGQHILVCHYLLKKNDTHRHCKNCSVWERWQLTAAATIMLSLTWLIKAARGRWWFIHSRCAFQPKGRNSPSLAKHPKYQHPNLLIELKVNEFTVQHSTISFLCYSEIYVICSYVSRLHGSDSNISVSVL